MGPGGAKDAAVRRQAAQGINMLQTETRAILPWAALGLVGLILIISVTYGFQYRFPAEQLLRYYQLASLPFLLILIGLSWYSVRGWSDDERAFSWPPTLGFALMSVSFVLTTFFQSTALRPVPWPLVAGGVLGVSAYSQFKWGARGSTLAFLICALILYAFMVARVPHTEGANMLEIIEAASGEFLAGKTPYHYYPWIAGDAPFDYLPGLWLPYMLLVKLGLDVRVFNLFALLLIVILFEKSVPKATRPEILSLTLYPIALSSPLAVMVVHGHLWPYWLFACGTMFLLIKKRFLLAAVCFGLSLASRQTALFLVGPLIAYMYREVGLKATLKYTGIGIVVFLCVVLPIAVWTGNQFWTFTYLGLAGISDTLQPHLSARSVMGLAGWVVPTAYWQFAIAILATALVLLRPKNDALWFVYTAGVVYSLHVFFSPYPVRYVYFAGFLIMAIGLSSFLATKYKNVSWNASAGYLVMSKQAEAQH